MQIQQLNERREYFPQRLRDRRACLNERARAAASVRMRERLARETALYPLTTQRRVLLAVAAEFGFDIDVLIGPRRFEEIIEARCAFALIVKRRLNASFPRIGRTLNRDHSCAIGAWEKANRIEANNQTFAARVARIEDELWPEQQTTGEKPSCAA